MSSIASAGAAELSPRRRLDALFGELAELTWQRNAIDGRIVEIVAEIERDDLWGNTGVRSIPALVAWKTGISPANAKTVATIAPARGVSPLREGDARGPFLPRSGRRDRRARRRRLRCALRTAGRRCHGHPVAHRGQARTRQEPDPRLAPQRSITKSSDEHGSCWRIRLDHLEAAKFDAALQSHLDALIAAWKRDHDGDEDTADQCPPLPDTSDAVMRLVEAGWDSEAAARPHGHHTTVVVHLNAERHAAALHLGPLLTDAERQYLTCDATFEAWFERDGEPIGAGRSTRAINRRLRRALEHRDRTCVVPGCGATRGLHAHHIVHWEHGGHTELSKLRCLCRFGRACSAKQLVKASARVWGVV